MQDTNLANTSDERIDPATEDLQRDILDEVKKLERGTNDLKFQNITVPAAAATISPESHTCNTVKVWTAATTVSVGDSNSQPCLLVQNIIYEIPINNVGNLVFTGSAGSEVVYLISSN
jgi:hypothetical protein